ncbi:MAG: hypothetical protein EOM67_12190 [Spirochaetia bacterium]|nr:hypothetical protein [Spirochaetia bacterium]
MKRIQTLCKKHHLMEISGVDINSSRQSFNCPELLNPTEVHLVESAWALVAHELLVNYKKEWGLFHPKNPKQQLSLEQRISLYGELGKKMDPYNPKTIIEIATQSLEGEF